MSHASTLAADWPEDVHTFWFETCTEQDWFKSSPELDELIRHRFAALHTSLVQMNNDALLVAPRTALAGVIVFDQFPRNMYRHTAAAFASDARALLLAELAIDQGLDERLPAQQRSFLYMPYMHAENRAAQARAVKLFASLADPDSLRAAHDHKAIVDRFGRFPHRNAANGRPDTPAERAYLEGDAKRFGQ